MEGWKVVDQYGNVQCPVCGKNQSPSFKQCVNCCPHEKVTKRFIPGDGPCCRELLVKCEICGLEVSHAEEDLDN